MTTRSSAFTRLRAWLHDGWISVGIALLLFLVLEFSYRALQRTRHEADGEVERVVTPGHPYYGQAWYAQLKPGLDARKNHPDPYRAYWPGPVTSRYVNIDTAGRRWTPQPVADTGAAVRVLMLGGSTMWGFTARDSFTIPALTAARLAAHGVRNAHVDNLAQAAFNTTQEASTLMLEVARGRVPDVVVLLDGFNDIATGLSYRDPGHTYGEKNTARLVELGRREFWEELTGLGGHSNLIAGLRAKLSRAPAEAERSPANIPHICGATGRYYAGIAKEVEGIGRIHDFPVIYFQQPVHSASDKAPSAWERSLPKRRGMRECGDSIDAAMADRAGKTYFSLRGIFDADTGTVFVDENAHLTEAANGKVAERIASVVAPLLQARLAVRSGKLPVGSRHDASSNSVH